jgi:hypothetical protein
MQLITINATSMMMRPAAVWRGQIGFDCVLLSGCVTHYFTACAYALIRLYVRTCRYRLQKNFDRFGAFFAFEGEYARGFIAHGFGRKSEMVKNPETACFQ